MATRPQISIKKNGPTGELLASGTSNDLGAIVQDTSYVLLLYIGNSVANTFLTIDEQTLEIDGSVSNVSFLQEEIQNGIVIPSASSRSLPALVSNLSGLFLQITLDTTIVGNKFITITYENSEAENSPYTYTFNFIVSPASTTTSDLRILFNSNPILPDSVLDVGFVAQGFTKNLEIYIANYGIPTLILDIDSITISNILGDANIVDNPTADSALSLTFNQSQKLNISVTSNTQGENSFVVTINSNDIDNPIYIFTVTYNVELPYILDVIVEGEAVDNDESISLGAITQNSNITKNIKITNRGVKQKIQITDINYFNSISFQNALVLPYLLEPFAVNSYVITVKMNTLIKGRKNGRLQIQYQVVN